MLAKKIVSIDKARIKRGLDLILADFNLDQITMNQIAKKAYRGFRCNLERKNFPRHKAIHEAIYRTAAEKYAEKIKSYDYAELHKITHITHQPKKLIHDAIMSKWLSISALIIAISAVIISVISLLKGH